MCEEKEIGKRSLNHQPDGSQAIAPNPKHSESLHPGNQYSGDQSRTPQVKTLQFKTLQER
ncbi:MAG: hypothetical protein AAFQ40_05015 [Cyanobacteria bacterium J06623_5]